MTNRLVLGSLGFECGRYNCSSGKSHHYRILETMSSSSPLRHAILGAGGIGGLMGACLARSGAPVTLVIRPESLAHYPEQLQLESAFGNFSVPVARASTVPAVDVLWITVKATQLEPALAE